MVYVNSSRRFIRRRFKYQKTGEKQSSHQSSKMETCKNYIGISLLGVPGKVFRKVLQRCMKSCVERARAEQQAGFRPRHGTTDQLFTIRQITEKYVEAGTQQTMLLQFRLLR